MVDPTRSTTRMVDPTRSTTRMVDPTRSTTRMLDPTWMVDLTRSTTRMLDPTRMFDPTRSMTRPVNARPGQQTQQPVTRAATLFHTRRTFWWRVRARVRVFLGNLDICKLVLKFSTMWYIYFACLKLLQI